jgi:hypothetical protein
VRILISLVDRGMSRLKEKDTVIFGGLGSRRLVFLWMKE